MVSYEPPMLKYLREVLDEHIIPLEESGGLVISNWLVDMIHKLEDTHING